MSGIQISHSCLSKAMFCLAVAVLVLSGLQPAQATLPKDEKGPSIDQSGNNAFDFELVGRAGGDLKALEAGGDSLYAAFDNEFDIISAPSSGPLTRVGYILLKDTIWDIQVQGNYAYLASDRLRIIDVSDPHSPKEILYPYPILEELPPGFGRVVVTESYAYLSTIDQRELWLYDISQPTQPALIDIYYPAAEWYWGFNFTASGSSAAILHTSGGLAWIDILKVSATNRLVFTGQTHMFDFATYDVYMAGGTLFFTARIAGRINLMSYDISDPEHPAQAGTYLARMGSYNFTTEGDYAYLFEQGEVEIVNVSNPGSMTLTITYTIPANPVPWCLPWSWNLGTCALSVSAGRLFISDSYNYIWTIDFSDPHNPSSGAVFKSILATANRSSFFVTGDSVFIGSDTGLSIVDISNPALPAATGDYILPDDRIHTPRLEGVYVKGSYAYTAFAQSGTGSLRIIDVSDLTNPSFAGDFLSGDSSMVTSLTGAGDALYFGNPYNGNLYVINISNPISPAIASLLPINFTYYGLIKVSGNLMIETGDHLNLIDITDPMTPVLMGSMPLQAGQRSYLVRDVALHGERVYLAYFDQYGPGMNGLLIVDVSDPHTPTILVDYPIQEYIHSLVVDNQFAYLAVDNGLKVLGVSDLQSIQPAGYYSIPILVGSQIELSDHGDILFSEQIGGHPFMALDIFRYDGLSIGGSVKQANGEPFQGAGLSLSVAQTITTSITGSYLFSDLPVGIYAVTPNLPGYVFSPPGRTLSLPPSLRQQDFIILSEPVSLAPGTLPARLTYTDTQGLTTTFDLPVGAIPVDSTLIVTPTMADPIEGLEFSGHAFKVEVGMNGVIQSGFTFSQPVTATIHYSEIDMWVVNKPLQPVLLWWDGSAWQDIAAVCGTSYANDITNRQISIPICKTGQFALYGPTHRLYMPNIQTR